MELRAANPLSYIENGDGAVYKHPEKEHDYIMTVDVGKGRGQDYSTFTLIDISVKPFEQVAVYRNNTISPLLFPTIIYKYAKVYNNAYVVIESNDQGSVVCNGMYYDLEYENVHMESSIKADAIGITMTRKVKRLGCSGLKDCLEASTGNHDDLVMNLVLFGYFVQTQMFNDMTDINLKEMLFKERMKQIEDDIVPFGFVDDGSEFIKKIEDDGKPDWYVEFDDHGIR